MDSCRGDDGWTFIRIGADIHDVRRRTFVEVF